MRYPECHSNHIHKNGKKNDKQNHIYADCGRQFVANPQTHRSYGDQMRKLCLTMYAKGSGFRAIGASLTFITPPSLAGLNSSESFCPMPILLVPVRFMR